MHNTTECQQKLVTLGYLEPGGADGVFGPVSLDAYNHYRASLGKPPVTPPIHLDALNADLFPEEQPPPPAPKSNPISDFITQAALKAVILQIVKGLPMSLIAGYKTYAVAIVSILVGVSDWIGFDIPGTNGMPPAAYILGGLIALFGRAGIAKIAEDVIGKLGGVDPDKQ